MKTNMVYLVETHVQLLRNRHRLDLQHLLMPPLQPLLLTLRVVLQHTMLHLQLLLLLHDHLLLEMIILLGHLDLMSVKFPPLLDLLLRLLLRNTTSCCLLMYRRRLLHQLHLELLHFCAELLLQANQLTHGRASTFWYYPTLLRWLPLLLLLYYLCLISDGRCLCLIAALCLLAALCLIADGRCLCLIADLCLLAALCLIADGRCLCINLNLDIFLRSVNTCCLFSCVDLCPI
jgi:hypothetical protein